jgi:hypothetical protein
VEFIIGGHRAKNKNLNNYKEPQRCIIYFYEIMNKKLFFITIDNITSWQGSKRHSIVLFDNFDQARIMSSFD